MSSSARARLGFLTALVVALVSVLSAALVGVQTTLAAADVEIIPQVEHDTSVVPLRDIPPRTPPAANKEESKDKRTRGMPQRPGGQRDTAVQGTTASATAATVSGSVDGVGNGFTGPAGTFSVNSAPPDTDSAVGATQVVEVVNSGFAVFDKATKAVLYGPAPTSSLFANFGGNYCQTTNDGDAVVRYDRAANRWIIAQFANAGSSNGPYYECVAVSTTSDATGAYNRYAYSFGSTFPDYPKLSVWPDAYYMTYNLFNGNSFAGARVCAMDRAGMLAGTAAAGQQCFSTSTAYGGLLAADNDGAGPPPSGAPNTVVSLGASGSTLAAWKYHVDWATPGNSTFTGPTTLGVAGYTMACNGGTCIPQLNTGTKLDSLADRLMYRLAYRNQNGAESLVVTHSVVAGSSTGVRWYELRLAGDGSVSVYQQGTYAPSSAYRWMGSAAMDRAGNIALGFSVSSSSTRPGLHITGRLAGDQLGAMTQGETSIVEGGGSQNGSLSRWGDYASMSVDPTDDCTFWFSSEYLRSSGSFNWSTRLASFTLPNCGAAPPPPPPPATNDFSISANPSAGTVTQGGSTSSTISTAATSGTAETVTLSASGLPSGATATFSPASVPAGQSATMTVATSTGTPAGGSTVTVTGTAPSATHTTSYALTVNAPPGSSPIVNGGFESGSLSGWTLTGAGGTTTSTPHAGSYAALVGSASPSGTSSIAQTFTAQSGATTVSFFYNVTCPDTVTYDWATATLRDNTTGTTTTLLAKTCTSGLGWKQATGSVTAGHSYTLTLTSRDDNYPGDPTYTTYDDVTVS